MAQEKVTMVEMESLPDKNGKTYMKAFPINRAEAILRMPKSGGWRLPENSKFKRDASGTIGFRQTPETSGNTGASGDTAKGGKESK